MTATKNEAAERLHFLFSLQPGNPKEPHNDLDAALAAERRATVERIRARLDRDVALWTTLAHHERIGKSPPKHAFDMKGVHAILDEEAARP